MRVNIFVGIEGTHHLVGDLFNDNTAVASPKMAMFIGPEARAHRDDSLETLLTFLFGSEATDECNIGVSRVGADGPLLQALLTSCPAGTRVFFFKLTDTEMSKDYQLRFLMGSSNSVAQRMTGVDKPQMAGEMDTISDTSFAMLDAAATKFEASAEWTNFGAATYFDGEAPADSMIQIRQLVK